jgi:hypothetical protein
MLHTTKLYLHVRERLSCNANSDREGIIEIGGIFLNGCKHGYVFLLWFHTAMISLPRCQSHLE